MKTPSASRERINPIVNAPMRRLISAPARLPDRTEPACAAHKFTFSGAADLAIVGQEVQDSLQVFALEECLDGRLQIDVSLLQWPVREHRSVQMPVQSTGGAERSQ